MSDRTLTFRHCGQEYTFTAGEQEFYTERGFSEPTRCKACRDKRKMERNSSGYDSYGSGGGSSYSGGGSSYSGGGGSSYSGGGGGYSGGGGGGGYGAPRQMYPAVCSSCGKETEVPFEPRTDKPVYCRECFQSRRVTQPRYGSNY